MEFFTLDNILGGAISESVEVKVPGEKQMIRVKLLSVNDTEKIELAHKNPDISDHHGMALYVSLALVDEKGETWLPVNKAREIKSVRLGRLFRAALKVNTESAGND